jgi:hypothetical protein
MFDRRDAWMEIEAMVTQQTITPRASGSPADLSTPTNPQPAPLPESSWNAAWRIS